MATTFVTERIEVGGLDFWLDGNSKVTAGNGTFGEPRPNAFSLVQVEDCPGSTAACREACYVHRLEKAEAEVHAKYRVNSRNLRALLPYPHPLAELAEALGEWIRDNAAGGFRWHVSGDVVDGRHAGVVWAAAYKSPGVRHWIYTRTFGHVRLLLGLPNLEVNISADRDNYPEARRLADEYGLRVCYLTLDGTVPPDLRDDDVIFPHHALRGLDLPDPLDTPFWRGLTPYQRGLVCPADYLGQSERRRCGPCARCLG